MMDDSKKIKALKVVLLALENIVRARKAGKEPEPFDKLVSDPGRHVGVTPEMARQVTSQPLSSMFEID